MKSFARLHRQYEHLAKRLHQLVQGGGWTALHADDQSRLRKRLNRLFGRLSGRFSRAALMGLLGGAAFLLHTSTVQAQVSFTGPTSNPFGLASVNNYGPRPSFADLDNDGDLDLLVSDYASNFYYFQNNGTNTTPSFASAVNNPFGLAAPFAYAYVISIDFGDIDGDGDFDLIAGDYYGNLAYYQNTGTAAAPAFAAAVPAPFSIATFPTTHSAPRFGDLDMDGDLDLLVGSYTGPLYYYQNTGTATSPAFGASQLNPFGITPPVVYLSVPDIGDLDRDGDMDIITGDGTGNLTFFANTGSSMAPAFGLGQANPFGLANVGSYSAPAFVDLDDDGDLDLMAMEEYGGFRYFENNSAPCATTTGSLTDVGCDSYTAPSGAMFMASGTYQDTISNVCGGDSIITLNLTINQSSSATLTEAACFEYLSPAGNTYTTSGTYNETLTNSVGCDSNLTINLTVTSFDLTVTDNGGVLSSAASGVTYQWLDCTTGPVAGQTGSSYTPTSPGDYAVILSDGNCTDTSACVTVTQVGIEPAMLTDVQLYPNPGNDRFFLDLGQRMEEFTVEVFDLNGRVIFRNEYFSEERLEVKLRPAAGLYHVRVASPEGEARLKWVVK